MLLEVNSVTKTFYSPGNLPPVIVLKGIDLQLQAGETIAILGESGSGKSTFLSLLAGLDRPTDGFIRLNKEDINLLSENDLVRFRAKNLGIVFQQFHLMSHLTGLENVSLPLELLREKEAQTIALEALQKVGLTDRQNHFPYQLSGGECQRVAIARAMVVQPQILLADEPTGNLDNKTGESVTELLFHLVEKNRMTLILVTHNEKLAARCQRQLYLKDGKLHENSN